MSWAGTVAVDDRTSVLASSDASDPRLTILRPLEPSVAGGIGPAA
jgi:hypothetical protein